MGTTCFLINTSKTTQQAIRDHEESTLIEGERPGFGFEYLTTKGATGYGVMYRQDPHTMEKKYFGIVFKTSRHRCEAEGMSEFCIKEIEESMGPYQIDAPAKMLDMLDKLAPNPTGYAEKWRKSCREKIEQSRTTKKAKPAAGQRVIYGGIEYNLIEPAGPRRGWRVSSPTGQVYRMNARQLGQAKPGPAAAPTAPEPTPSKQISAAQFFADHFQIVIVGDKKP
jgi:hypothetical protein